MIEILSGNPAATDVVLAAFRRSCGFAAVKLHDGSGPVSGSTLVMIDAVYLSTEVLSAALCRGFRKICIFGNPGSLLEKLGFFMSPLTQEVTLAAHCEPAKIYNFSEASASIVWRDSVANERIPLPRRSLTRFDFTDEWNNLGFGSVRADDSIWSISCLAQTQTGRVLADVEIGQKSVSAWSVIWDDSASSIFWFNRAVGPVDSHEWCHVEAFLSRHRFGELPCQPVIEQVPFGYDAAVTMRLDCDEDIENARSLFELYKSQNVPFSIAILTKLLVDERHHLLPRDVIASGGSVLSHSVTHASNWGGSYAEAFNEARLSSEMISSLFGVKVRSAVSPFHQSPAYSRLALADAGYASCVGGIIRNDPDFLMARAGYAPQDSNRLIGHSQQCMFHGDCLLETGDPIQIYKQAFDAAKASKTFFGYLDHPFSDRYAYGWKDESQRSAIHYDFLNHIRAEGLPLLANENDALNFLHACAVVSYEENDGKIKLASTKSSKWPIAIAYGGNRMSLERPMELAVHV